MNEPPKKKRALSRDEVKCCLDRKEMNIAEETSKKKKSKCWTKFGHPVQGAEVLENFVACRECRAVYQYDSKQGNGVMDRHRCVAFTKPHPNLTSFGVTRTPAAKVLPQTVQSQVNEGAVMFACKDMRPMAMFRQEGFLEFAQLLVDKAAQHGRFDVDKTIVDPTNLTRKHLGNVYQRLRTSTLAALQKCDAMGNTTDIWLETHTNTSYISLASLFITNDFVLHKVLWMTAEFPYEDILQWWAERAAKYPNLSRAVCAILCTPASSATSDGAFSAAGFTINKRRCSLSPETSNFLFGQRQDFLVFNTVCSVFVKTTSLSFSYVYVHIVFFSINFCKKYFVLNFVLKWTI